MYDVENEFNFDGFLFDYYILFSSKCFVISMLHLSDMKCLHLIIFFTINIFPWQIVYQNNDVVHNDASPNQITQHRDS